MSSQKYKHSEIVFIDHGRFYSDTEKNTRIICCPWDEFMSDVIQFFKALWRIGDSVNWIIIGQKQPVSPMLAVCEIMCVRIDGEIWINM